MDSACGLCGADLITLQEQQEALCEHCIFDREFWSDWRTFCVDWDAKQQIADAARYKEWLRIHPEEARLVEAAHHG